MTKEVEKQVDESQKITEKSVVEERVFQIHDDFKSYVAKGVIFQLLEYMAQIYQKHYNKKSGKVPIVIPIVVYHGEKKWKAEKEFLSYVDIDLKEDSELLQYIPNFFYKLYDIPRMDISEEELSNELKCFVIALGIRNHKDKLKDFIRTLDKVEKKEWGLKALKYLEEILNDEERETLENIIDKENLERGDEFMTIAQSYRQEGIEEGIQQGVHIGELKIALKFLKKGYTLSEVSEIAEISKEEIEELAKKNNIKIV